MQTETNKGILLGVLAATLWGISGTLGQYLFEEKNMNVEWLITVRLLIAGIGLLLLAKVTRHHILLFGVI